MGLNKAQIKLIKKVAHTMKPLVQVGKLGIGDTQLHQIDITLNKRELIKISLLQNAEVSIEQLQKQLAQHLGATIIQIIGRTLIVYKPSADKQYQDLSLAVAALHD